MTCASCNQPIRAVSLSDGKAFASCCGAEVPLTYITGDLR